MLKKKKIQIILERGAQKPYSLAPNEVAYAPLQLNIKWAFFSCTSFLEGSIKPHKQDLALNNLQG